MGVITRDMKTTLEINTPEIIFDVLDWNILENYTKFYNEKYWKNYDAIIIDPHLASVSDSGWPLSEEDRPQFKSKLIPVYHTELDICSNHFNHGWYKDWFETPIGAINNYILNQIKNKGEKNVLLPIGVNTKKFFPFKTIDSIKKIGFIGDNPKDDWKLIKRPEMFKEICKQTNIEPVIIKGREHGFEMYEDIDAVICTSTVEGLPTAFAEVVACKIPFISTNVGIIRDYNNVKTFETIDQAIKIINELNQDPKNIEKYVDTLYNDLLPSRDWKNIIKDYWIPHFNYLKENQQ
jgi:hypothetical protein